VEEGIVAIALRRVEVGFQKSAEI